MMERAAVASVATGAVAGAVCRYGVVELCRTKKNIKCGGLWAIAGINILGSFALGTLMAAPTMGKRGKLLLGTGFCGAFTTFSTFSVDTMSLLLANQFRTAAVYVFVNNVGSIGAATLGYMAVKRWKRV